MREIVHLQAGQCGNQIGSKVIFHLLSSVECMSFSRCVSKCWIFPVGVAAGVFGCAVHTTRL